MKKLFFCLVLFTVPLFAQMDTDSTRSIVPRTTSKGMIGTPAKIWRAIRADSLVITYFPGILKSDSSTMPGYATRTQFASDTTYKASRLVVLNAQIISFFLDSSYVNLVDTVWCDLPGVAVVVDSISIAPNNGGTAVAITPKYFHRTAPFQTCTSIVTTPGSVTSSIAKTWHSTIASATLPANGQVGVCFTTVTTKPKSINIGIKVHR